MVLSPLPLIFPGAEKNLHCKNNQYLINSRAADLPFSPSLFQRIHLQRRQRVIFVEGVTKSLTRTQGRLSRLMTAERSVNSFRGEQSSTVIPSPGGKGDPPAIPGKSPRSGAEPSQHPQGNSTWRQNLCTQQDFTTDPRKKKKLNNNKSLSVFPRRNFAL